MPSLNPKKIVEACCVRFECISDAEAAENIKSISGDNTEMEKAVVVATNRRSVGRGNYSV